MVTRNSNEPCSAFNAFAHPHYYRTTFVSRSRIVFTFFTKSWPGKHVSATANFLIFPYARRAVEIQHLGLAVRCRWRWVELGAGVVGPRATSTVCWVVTIRARGHHPRHLTVSTVCRYKLIKLCASILKDCDASSV